MQIDDKLKGLIKELGDAINGALSQSVEINDAIQNVRDAGYEVVLAQEGREALALFEQKKFDAVFTDLGLPGMSGWQLAQRHGTTL